MNGKKNNHTNFTDAAQSAINAENAAKKPGRKKSQPTFKLSSKWTESPGPNPAPKTTQFTSVGPAPDQFYTQDGLRIPLYNASGKRITHARDGRVLLHKHNKKTVLDEVVRKYAGDAVAKTMESWTKDQIGDWVTEVETRAFGHPPRGKAGKKGGEGKRDLASASATKSAGLPSGSFRRMSTEMATGEEGVQGRVTRTMSEEMSTLLGLGAGDQDADEEVETQTTTTTTTLPPNGYALPQVSTLAAKRKYPEAPTAQPPKRQKPNPLAVSPPSSRAQLVSLVSNPPPAPTKPPLKLNPHPNDWFPWPTSHIHLLPPRSTSLIRPKAVRALALTPHWTPSLPSTTTTTTSTPLRTIPLPLPLTHTLLLSTPTTLHILSLPHHDLHSQRAAQSQGKKIPAPHRRMKNKTSDPNPMVNAYLKEGKHGYDWGAHRWGFEGDADLLTGVGHQVEVGDREAYARGELWGKYPGRRGGVWPCGCRIGGREGEGEESEEE